MKRVRLINLKAKLTRIAEFWRGIVVNRKRWKQSSTNSPRNARGDGMGVPATGNRVETTGIVIFRLDDGQIVEERTMDDIFGLLQQIGEYS